MLRLTTDMFVVLTDKGLKGQHGTDPCRILRVGMKKVEGMKVPSELLLAAMDGSTFKAAPGQVVPY